MHRRTGRAALAAAFILALAAALPASAAQETQGKKIFIITDLEGVDGIFNFDLQCNPDHSPRYAESRKLLTDEVNAAVDGFFAGGATEIVVYDGHAGGINILPMEIDPRVRLLQGQPISPTLELDRSYAAIAFIGLHARAGAANAILPHTYTWDIENICVNGRRVGEIGGRTMLAGTFGIPAIMLSGDSAACREFLDLVPNAECAEVKSGVSASAGFALPHREACDLIRTKARRAMERLAEIKPLTVSGPVEVKVEFTTRALRSFAPREGVEQLDGRTWVFRGKDLRETWLKYSSF